MTLKHISLLLLIVTLNISSALAETAINDIKLRSANGDTSINSFKGKYIYLDFWASWCGPCRKSFPWMNSMLKKYSAHGLTILAVNVDQEQEMASLFLNKTPAKFDIAYDPEGELAAALKLRAMPSSFLIDQQGNIKQSHAGFKSKNVHDYENSLRSLLGLKPLKSASK